MYPSHGHTRPDAARFWIREDAKQKDGLPLGFECVAIVKYAAPENFQAVVDVRTGPIFDMLAQPWAIAEPVVFRHGVEIGEPVGHGDAGIVDFASLTVRDWSELVGVDGLVAARMNARVEETPCDDEAE